MKERCCRLQRGESLNDFVVLPIFAVEDSTLSLNKTVQSLVEGGVLELLTDEVVGV